MIDPYQKNELPYFSKGEVRRAGELLKAAYLGDNNISDADITRAQKLVQDWRSTFLYPLNTLQAFFRSNLKALGYKDVPIGQRLKRLVTITDKLTRMKGTLDTMQDIGGIRIVLENMEQVTAFNARLERSRTKHVLHNTKDYIQYPKPDGYRSIHHVYACHSQQAPEQVQGLKVELQLRTLLQHYWATAVESVSMFYGQSLKTGKGDDVWKEFFLLSSAAFALMEGTPLPPPYAQANKEEIHSLLTNIYNEQLIYDKLDAIRALGFLAHYSDIQTYKYGSLFFTRNDNGIELSITFHDTKKEENALKQHNHMERTFPIKEGSTLIDTVFVKTESKHLKKLYANYFLEIDNFIKHIQTFLASSE